MRLARGIDTTLRVSDLLGDYERKRGRAMLHYNVLCEPVERFDNADRDPVRGEFDVEASQYVFKVPLEGFDPDWTLILGEFAYDTRASLDYLITALVRSTGKEVNERNQFPIYGIREDVGWTGMHDWWDRARLVSRQLQNTPPETRAALKPLQPFYGVPRTNPFNHPLWALRLLNNRDKHRRLNLLARSASVDFVDASGKPIFPTPPFPTRITKGDEGSAYVVTFRVTPASEYANMDMYLLAPQQVALDEPPELIGDLIETLAGINAFIDTRVPQR